jgi:laminin alpha 3/5
MLYVLQYNLGGGLLQITSQKTYNDDKWHTVEAVREKEKGVLRIDGVPEFQASAPERATQLQVSVFIYVFFIYLTL